MTYNGKGNTTVTEFFRVTGDGVTANWTFDLENIKDAGAKISVHKVDDPNFSPSVSNPSVEQLANITKEMLSESQCKVTFTSSAPVLPIAARREIQSYVCDAVSTIANAGGVPADYLLISSTTVDYYIWFNVTDGSVVDPAVAARTGIQVDVLLADTAQQVSDKIAAEINTNYRDIFFAHNASLVGVVYTPSTTVVIENEVGGVTTDGTDGSLNLVGNWAYSNVQQGAAEIFSYYLVSVTGKAEGIKTQEMVLFTNTNGAKDQIYAINPQGSSLIDVTNDISYNYNEVTISADGKKAVFICDATGNFEVYISDFSLTRGIHNKVKLSNHAGAKPFSPVITKDNDLVIWTTVTGANSASEFHAYRISTSTLTNMGTSSESVYVQANYTARADFLTIPPSEKYLLMGTREGNISRWFFTTMGLEIGNTVPSVNKSYDVTNGVSGQANSRAVERVDVNATEDKVLITVNAAQPSTWVADWDKTTRIASNHTKIGGGTTTNQEKFGTFSPDGTEYVYRKIGGGDNDIRISDITGVFRITLHVGGDEPTWALVVGE
jgi:hypothetical protein